MKRSGILFLALILSFPVFASVQGDSTQIRELLQQRDREIKDLLGPEGAEYTEGKREKLKDIINGIIDYPAMARYALQETFDTLSAEEREEFVDLLSTIIRDQSLNKLDIYRAEVIYNEIEVKGDSANVNTTAILDDVRTPVSYQMHYKESPDEWVITDLTIDDVSTADSYRRQFQNIIRKRGYDYLLNTLKKRAAR